jgi:hypothetical protein
MDVPRTSATGFRMPVSAAGRDDGADQRKSEKRQMIKER